MRNQLVFTFGHVPPKKNSRQYRKGKHGGGYTVPSDAFKQWHDDMTCEYQIHARLLRSPVSITAKYWAGSLSTMDMSNCEEGLHDWLVNLGVIHDDCIFDLQAYTCELAGLRRGLPKVEVTVAEMDWLPAQQGLYLLRNKDALRTHVERLKGLGVKTSQAAEVARLWEELEDFEAYNEKNAPGI